MKRTALLISAVLVAIAVNAQLLWKVTGGQLPKPSYLFGTMHVVDGGFIDSVPGLDDVIKHVDACYVEIKHEEMTNPETLTYLTQLMMAPQDSTIDKLLSPDGMQIVAGTLDKYFGGMVSIDAFKQLKPSAIMQQLVLFQSINHIEHFDPNNLIDAAVEKRVMGEQQATYSLETVEFQGNLLFNAPLTKQAADLLEVCKADANIETKMTELCKAYQEQDLGKILDIMQDPSMGGNPEDLETLIFNRNRNWVRTLVPAMEKESVLVSVGAGHLPTGQGLIQLLRNEGLTVEAVQ